MARLNIDIPVVVVQGGKVVYDPRNPNHRNNGPSQYPTKTEVKDNTIYEVVYPQNESSNVPQHGYYNRSANQQMAVQANAPTSAVPWPNPVYTSNQDEDPRRLEVAPGKKLMFNPLAQEKIMTTQRPPYQTQTPNLPQIPKTTYQPQPQQEVPQYTTPLNTVGPIKEFEHYYRNGILYFYWPKNIKNDIIQWLRHVEEAYGQDLASMIAKRLEIEYIPKEIWDKIAQAANASLLSKQQPVTPQQVMSNVPSNNPYPASNLFARKSSVETIIAPPTSPQQLNVEKTDHWTQHGYGSIQIEDNKSPVNLESRPTTGLFVAQPMSVEQLEAANQPTDDNAIMGFPGVAAIDTAKFKEYMPRIANMVKQRFDNFPLSEDAERQCLQLSYDISHFIADDIKDLMKDDGKGLVVKVVRSVDNRNQDCFIVTASNYNSPLFEVSITPSINPSTETNVQNSTKEEPYQEQTIEELIGISTEELANFFADHCLTFKAADYAHSPLDFVKKALASHLATELRNVYGTKITVPRAYKEAMAYIEQAVEFKNKKTENSKSDKNNSSSLKAFNAL